MAGRNTRVQTLDICLQVSRNNSKILLFQYCHRYTVSNISFNWSIRITFAVRYPYAAVSRTEILAWKSIIFCQFEIHFSGYKEALYCCMFCTHSSMVIKAGKKSDRLLLSNPLLFKYALWRWPVILSSQLWGVMVARCWLQDKIADVSSPQNHFNPKEIRNAKIRKFPA